MKASTIVLCVVIGTVLAEIVRPPANAAVKAAAISGGNQTGT